jgi:hypothetical protein
MHGKSRSVTTTLGNPGLSHQSHNEGLIHFVKAISRRPYLFTSQSFQSYPALFLTTKFLQVPTQCAPNATRKYNYRRPGHYPSSCLPHTCKHDVSETVFWLVFSWKLLSWTQQPRLVTVSARAQLRSTSRQLDPKATASPCLRPGPTMFHLTTAGPNSHG